MTRVGGADGWKGRWVVALLDPDALDHDAASVGTPEVGWAVLERPAGPAELVDLDGRTVGELDVLAVDVPIGLPPLDPSRQRPAAPRHLAGRRQVDQSARDELAQHGRGRSSSVFPALPREVVEQVVPGEPTRAERYAAARRLASAHDVPVPSSQAYALVEHLHGWDAVVRAELAEGVERVVETHPEVVAARLLGRLPAQKRTPRGIAERLLAVDGALGAGASWRALWHAPPGVPVDDAVDALLCAVAAAHRARGTAETLPAEPPPEAAQDSSPPWPPRDAEGVPMRLVLPPRRVDAVSR